MSPTQTTCPECEKPLEAGRAFCPHCGHHLNQSESAQPRMRGATYDDVQMIDFARIPSELRAPSSWTIAKGVFFGMWFYSLTVAIVWLLLLLLVFSRSSGPGLEDLGDPFETETTFPSR